MQRLIAVTVVAFLLGAVLVAQTTWPLGLVANRLGLGAEFVPDATIHIRDGATTSMGDIRTAKGIIIENGVGHTDTHPGIQIISGTSGCGHIWFGDTDDSSRAEFNYDHAADRWEWNEWDGGEGTMMTLDANTGELSVTGNLKVNGGTFTERFVEVVTTTNTSTLSESFGVFTNTGDADGSTHTLLNDPAIGAQYTFIAMEAQTMTISPSAGETIEADGSVCADVRIGAAVGESLTLLAAEGGAGGVCTPIASHGGFTCTP